LTSNTTNDNADVGLILQSQSDYNTITEHTSNNNSNGIKLIGANSNQIKNNS